VGKKRAALLVAGALLVGACGGTKSASTDGPSAASPTTHRAHPTTTTTVSPPYSFDDSVPPPPLVNTGTNYIAILKSLEAYGDWTTAHRPDPTLVSRFVAAGTKLYDAYLRTLTKLRHSSQRFVELRDGEDRYTIVSRTADAISAEIVQRISWHRIVDITGNTIDQAHFTGTTSYRVLAVKTSGRWSLASMTVTRAPDRVS
jgi:hypothetical protein